ncbi:MAG TPA: hypothetical protein VK939_11870 [Longimicrobiales bacterium]|nr:hypothetical protein [Longimicrobiales bacterium]
MKRLAMMLSGLAVALLASTGDVRAQGIALTPTIGGYVPASDFYELRDEADRLRVERDPALALGLNAELGWLRGSLVYATGARLTGDGLASEGQIGEGSLLAASADLVLRPVPRLIIVQPYLLGGIGVKNTSYDFDEDGAGAAFPDGRTDTALHIGVGADLMLGGIGLVAEVSDYISKDGSGDFRAHDAFAMVGLKFRLGL